jgi:antitoxin component YwqK of YwqJK toxin-antitoxin module
VAPRLAALFWLRYAFRMQLIFLACVSVLVLLSEPPVDPVPTHDVRVVDGKKEGTEVRRNGEGKVRDVVTWKDGKKNGPFKSYHENGRESERGQYENGVKVGTWLEYNSCGEKTWETPYVNGLREGVRRQWFNDCESKNNPQPLASEVTFKLGIKDGPSKDYWSDGPVSAEGEYKDGEKEGTWSYYYSTGQPMKTVTYSKGEKVAESKK